MQSDTLKERLRDMAVLSQSTTPSDALNRIEELEIQLEKAANRLKVAYKYHDLYSFCINRLKRKQK